MTITQSKGRYIITASKGKLVTNGIDVFAVKVILAVDRAYGTFFEIDPADAPEACEVAYGL